MRTAKNTYEASKQDGPRSEARNETRGETLQGHDETKGQTANTAAGDCVFVSTCRERDRGGGTEAV